METSDEDLAFEHELLPSLELPIGARSAFVPLTLERRLAALEPTLVIAAGLSPFVSGRIAAFADRHGVTFGLWSGDHAAMATAMSRLRRAQRRRLVARADFAIAYGYAAAEYLQTLRPDIPLVYGRNTSVSYIAPRSANGCKPIEVLAVGDLASPRKGIDILIDALQLSQHLPVRLTVIGGGKLLPQLALAAREDGRIRLLGPLPPAAVRGEYAKADVFAFPSRADVFGLALVEAMAFGLATLTSSRPGVVADLCVDQHNCLVVQSNDPRLWAARLGELAERQELRETLGKRAHQTVARRWTLDHAVDAMLAGLRLGVLARGGEGGRAIQ
jgi:glycosyltransferase involved in cell wall biosynthesis